MKELLLLLCCAAVAVHAAPGKPQALKTNFLSEPLGVDDAPHFAWTPAPSTARLSPAAHMRSYELSLEHVAVNGSALPLWSAAGDAANVPRAWGPSLAALETDEAYRWRVRLTDSGGGVGPWSDYAPFRTGILAQSEWAAAKWLLGGKAFRAAVTTPPKVVRATAFVCGIGYGELYIDGAKVGSHRLDPTPSLYPTRSMYSTFDVTASLATPGAHGLGLLLGSGWLGESWQKGTPQIIALFRLRMADGSTVEFHTDETWTSDPDPWITYDGLYNGETVDARKYVAEWSNAECKMCAGWPAAKTAAHTVGAPLLSSQLMQPISVVKEIKPRSMWSPEAGVFIFDFGVYFVGWCRLKVKGSAGTTVTMHWAESVMHPPYGSEDGSLYFGSMRGAKTTDTYITSGDSNGETFEPHFTSHGGRYVELRGYPGTPTLDALTAVVAHSSMSTRGVLSISNGLLDRIHQNAVNVARLNLMGIPTDCPQRDERRGWLGDAALASEYETLNFDMAAFYAMYLRNIEDNQASDGGVPEVVPYRKATSPDPAWSTAYDTIAWQMLHYEDAPQAYKDRYPSLTKYMAFLKAKYQESGLAKMFSTWGDWCPPPEVASDRTATQHMVSSSVYLHDLTKMADVANSLGNTADAQAFLDLRAQLATEYNKAFFDSASAKYGTGSHTSVAMPLWLELVPADKLQAVLDNLEKYTTGERANHFGTGIIGMRYLLEALSAQNRSDLALLLAAQTSYPSFGYQVLNRYEPATAVWELWDSDTHNPDMDSRAHDMFATVDSWLWKSIGGISVSEHGWKEITVRPDVAFINRGGVVTSAQATVHTLRGEASASWKTHPKLTPQPCMVAAENGAARLVCPDGQVIDSVEFASFGTPPTGTSWSCDAPLTKGNCSAANSESIVLARCKGLHACDVPATDAVFGDPCYSIEKHLAVRAKCVPAAYNCEVVEENDVLNASCAAGVISKIAFASYGTPPDGQVWKCGSSMAEGSCNAPRSRSEVAERCVGKASCQIIASNAMFGHDPCFDVKKQLAVTWECEDASPLTSAVAVEVTIPPTATGQVFVPIPPGVASPTVKESGSVVWSAEKFVPGVSGVVSGERSGRFVKFSTLSGSYSFSVPL